MNGEPSSATKPSTGRRRGSGRGDAGSRTRIKRLILLCDGTGQSSARAGTESSFPTNVKNLGDCLLQSYKVKNAKAEEEEIEQVIFYQSGIGTSTVPIISRALASGVAYGIEDNILDAYYFLCSNYDPGDEIFIFGFSRGAFIARILANWVVRMGLLRMNVSWMIRKAWTQYMKKDGGKSFDFFLKMLHSPKFKGRTQRVRVKVLGVWDTVAAVGFNNSYQQFDTKLYWGIENAFHALALDEKRFAFGPTMFYLSPDPKPKWLIDLDSSDSEALNKEIDTKICNLKQCWFAGAHTDVGGGYASSHQSNITLAWMIDNCQSMLGFNSSVDWNHEDGRRWRKIINGHHRPSDAKYGNFARESLENGCLEQKYPGWACGIVRDSYAEFYWCLRWQYRCPGNYIAPNNHTGPWGLSIIPIPSIATVFGYLATGCLTAASYVLPASYCNGNQNLRNSYGKTCTHPSCLLPPLTQQRVTNETIHQSVYRRLQKAEEARRHRPGFVRRFKTYMSDQKPVRTLLACISGGSHKPRIRDPSEWLANWNPESLKGFRRVGEKDKPGMWIGKCAVSGVEFEIPEEPEHICENGLMQQLMNRNDPKPGLSWEAPESPLRNEDRKWNWWLEDDVDYAECNAIGKDKYVDTKHKKLQPRWFFQRWLGLSEIPHPPDQHQYNIQDKALRAKPHVLQE